MKQVAARLIVILLLSLYFPLASYAALPTATPLPSGQHMDISPNTVTLGDLPLISLTGLNKPTSETSIKVALGTVNAFSSVSTSPNNVLVILVESDGSCSIHPDVGATNSVYTSAHCQGSGPINFFVNVDTSKLGISSTSTSDQPIYVFAKTPPGPDFGLTVDQSGTFTVLAPAVDDIFDASFDPNPANTSDTITATLTLKAHKLGNYSYYLPDYWGAWRQKTCNNLVGSKVTPSPGVTPPPPTCTFTFSAPSESELKSTTVEVDIKEPGCDVNDDTCGKAYTITVGRGNTHSEPSPGLPPCNNPVHDSPCNSVNTAIGSFDTDPQGFITSIMGFLLSISGGIALLIIIYAGYKMLTSTGKPEAVKAARELLTSAIVGLLFIILSLVILEVIGVDILHIPGFVATGS